MTSRPDRLNLLALTLQGRKRRTLFSLEGRKEAAVLVPIVRSGDVLEVLFTLRTDTLPTHKGQVAFPGGGIEPDDRDAIAAALRESDEEIGLPPSSVDVLGLGDDVFSITGQKVTPVVGYIHDLPELRPNPGEIADIFTVSLTRLMAPDAFYESDLQAPTGTTRKVSFFQGGKHQIWGLTAWVLRELLVVMGGGAGP